MVKFYIYKEKKEYKVVTVLFIGYNLLYNKYVFVDLLHKKFLFLSYFDLNSFVYDTKKEAKSIAGSCNELQWNILKVKIDLYLKEKGNLTA